MTLRCYSEDLNQVIIMGSQSGTTGIFNIPVYTTSAQVFNPSTGSWRTALQKLYFH